MIFRHLQRSFDNFFNKKLNAQGLRLNNKYNTDRELY